MKKIIFLLLVSCQLNAQPTKTIKSLRDYVDKKLSEIRITTVDLKPNSLRSFGAIPDDGIDDYPPFQKCINFYIANRLSFIQSESGKYDFSEGIVIRKGEIGKPSEFVSLSIYGDGNAMDPDIGGGTLFYLWDKNEAAIYIQHGKGCEIKYINVRGQNTGLYNFSYADIVNEKDNFNPNGCLDTRTAMHCAAIIDPFSQPSEKYKFVKKTRYYSENQYTTESGSTGIRISDFYASSLIAGIVISPTGSQNGEDGKFTNIWMDHMKICFASGNVQNRTNHIRGFTNWGTTLFSFDSRTYGTGAGCPFFVDGFNIAGANKWIFNTGSWYGNQENIYNGQAEEIYGIGGCFSGRDVQINITGATIFLMGNHAGVRLPSQIVQAKTLNMRNSQIFYYSKPASLIGLSVDYATFDNCKMTAPAITTSGSIKYINTDIGLEKNINETPFGYSATAAKVESVNNYTWTFRTSNKINIGEYISIWKGNIKSEFQYGSPMITAAGTVQSINGDLITVLGTPYNLNVGQDLDIYNYKIMAQ